MISQVSVCKSRKSYVFKNIQKWLDSSIDQLIVVDYACTEHAAKELLASKYGSNPRLTVLAVSPRIAGPFYRGAFARNLGALAAKHSYLFFLDADCYCKASFLEDVLPDLDFDDDEIKDDNKPELICCCTQQEFNDKFMNTHPSQTIKRQFIVHNSLFHRLNGFCEAESDWGCDVFDFYNRAATTSDRIKLEDTSRFGFRCANHSDDLRDCHLPKPIGRTDAAKIEYCQKRIAFYTRMAEISNRAQPNRRMGIDKYTSGIRVFSGGIEHNFNPGEE